MKEVERHRSQEFNAEALRDTKQDEDPQLERFPSPFEAPGVRMVETWLAPTGLRRPSVSVAGPRNAAAIISHLVGDADREHFVALYLNARHEVTHAHVVSCGSTQSAPVHPREVFKAGVLANAAAIVVGHNHPTGDVSPSEDDKAVLERLKKAGNIMGIQVLDGLIVGPSGMFYAASTDTINTLSPLDNYAAPEPRGPTTREAHLEELCHGLLQDIDEVLERQGEGWWDETVTSGTHNRNVAEKGLGRKPYAPLRDDGAPGPAQ